MAKKIVIIEGKILIDPSKPVGTSRKLMDVAKLNRLCWKAEITLEDGIQKVYEEIKDRDWSIYDDVS